MISKLGGTAWWFPGSSVVRILPDTAGDVGIQSLGQEDILEEKMAS